MKLRCSFRNKLLIVKKDLCKSSPVGQKKSLYPFTVQSLSNMVLIVVDVVYWYSFVSQIFVGGGNPSSKFSKFRLCTKFLNPLNED